MNYCKDCKFCLVEKEFGWRPVYYCTHTILYNFSKVTGKLLFESLPYCKEKREKEPECRSFKKVTTNKTSNRFDWLKKQYKKMTKEEKECLT